MINQDVKIKEIIGMTNGVIGLSILTMPFCFQQCGLILGSIALFMSAMMTAYSCRLLVNLIEVKKTKTFEFLALRIFGHKAKLLLEISIIILLFGSLVTYQQTVSDSGPNFLCKLLNLNLDAIPRSIFMTFFTVFITLPLSLSNKLEKINKLSAFAIFAYFIFGFYLFWKASEKFFDDESTLNLNFWNFRGLLRCFPIFSMSFSCQTVIFVVYSELPENSKHLMIKLSDKGITIAFVAYFMSGFFGYLAFSHIEIPGNVIKIIPESLMSQIIIFGFIVCVISGLPYMIFPCRTSLNTLIFSREHDEIIESEMFMPEYRFRYFTYFIVFFSTFTAILIPSMEFVLSLTGATAGSLICYVWPSLLFMFAKSQPNRYKDIHTNIFLAVGLIIFCVCTTAELSNFKPNIIVLDKANQISVHQLENQIPFHNDLINNINIDSELKDKDINAEINDHTASPNDIRHEPPNPSEQRVKNDLNNMDKNEIDEDNNKNIKDNDQDNGLNLKFRKLNDNIKQKLYLDRPVRELAEPDDFKIIGELKEFLNTTAINLKDKIAPIL